MHVVMAEPPPDASQDALHAATELLRALGSPVRLGIVRELANGGREVHELVAALGVSQPLVSQHLRVLRAARLVVGTRHARAVEYSLTDHHVAHIVLDALRHVQEDDPARDDSAHDDSAHDDSAHDDPAHEERAGPGSSTPATTLPGTPGTPSG
jgi:ArsR family transcriptional regulator, zinc-responsive transcriptional repressor